MSADNADIRPTVTTRAQSTIETLVIKRRWPLALVVALVVVGPVILPGAVFNLDLVLVPRLDVPAGFWGLGPELPRRLPLWVPISLLSALVPATLIGKSILVGQLVLGWTGMARRFSGTGTLAPHVIGALYVLGPFMATRAVVGHFMITVPLALLPWVLPTLARPGRRLGTTFLAASALAIGGHYGGSLAVLVVVAAVVVGARDRWLPAILVTIAAQSPWLVPGVVVWLASNRSPSSSVVFATAVDGPAGVARVFGGGGFWNTFYQTGGTGAVAAAIGITLLALALYGTRDLPHELRALLELLAAVGLIVTLWSAAPLVDDIFGALTSNPVFAVWRESQRLLGLVVLWIAPSAVLGARRLAVTASRSGRWASAGAVAALPCALLVVQALPLSWGYGGRLESTPLPDSWNQAREIVRADEGTILVLPWRQYFNLQVGDGDVHRVLNPMPLFLGGDVISSSDNQLGADVRERGDPREAPADAIIERIEQGDTAAGELADIGVRWVVLLDTVHADLYAGLTDDPALEQVLDTGDIDVFELESWTGAAVRADGSPVSVRHVIPGFTLIDGAATEWNGPAARGLRRGWRATGATDSGTIALRPGSQLVWNVATLPALIGQLVPFVVLLVLINRRRPGRDADEGS